MHAVGGYGEPPGRKTNYKIIIIIISGHELIYNVNLHKGDCYIFLNERLNTHYPTKELTKGGRIAFRLICSFYVVFV